MATQSDTWTRAVISEGKHTQAAERAGDVEPRFYDALMEVMERQYRNYDVYRSVCQREGLRLGDLKRIVKSGELQAIPAVPADWFKRGASSLLFTKLADFTKKGFWLVSSATGGDPSYVWRTEADRQSVIDSFSRAYRKVPLRRCLAFSPDPATLRKAGKRFAFDEHRVEFYAVVPSVTSEIMFHRVDFLTRTDILKTLWSMLKTRGKGRPVMVLNRGLLMRALEDAEHTDSAIVLASSPLLLYPVVKSLPRAYNLGKNAYFLTGGGGWDGKKGFMSGKPIDKRKYVEDMCEKLCIPEDAIETNFWDTFGTAENGKAQPGPFSTELGDFVYEVGDDARLYAIDPVEGLAREGEKGFPVFISPYGVEGFAGACVQQQDIIHVVSVFDDGTVRKFRHVHRASCAGCALDAVEGVRL